MGKGDRRLSNFIKQRRSQAKKKARAARRLAEGKARAAEKPAAADKATKKPARKGSSAPAQ